MKKTLLSLFLLLFCASAWGQNTFELPALGGAPATGDLLRLVDISNTTASANGTDVKLSVLELLTTPRITTHANFGSAGVRLSDDGDGAITFLGLGNGSDEDFTLNLDDTANTVSISSSTGVNAFDFGTIGITTSGTVAAGTLTGSAGGVTLDASGFDGNLATTDNTFQEVAQKLDDLSAGAGSLTSTRVGYGDGSNLLTGEAAFTYNAGTNTLTVENISSSGTATVTTANVTTFRVLDNVDQSHGLSFIVASDLAANRTLTITTGDANRAITLTGDLIRVGAHSLTLTTGATTDVTLPASGTLLTTTGVGTGLTALNGENIQDDTIDDDSLDFGTGADQISAADVPIADTGSIFTATDAEAALLELAKVPTKNTATSYTIGTTDARELYGGVIYVTGAATITIPAVAAGASFTVITVGAVAVSVDPNASDLIVLDGTALSDGDKVTNTSTTGDIAVFTYYDGTGWYCTSNSWTDGN